MDMRDVRRALVEHGDNPMKILEICGGYYVCPKDSSGKRLGPLVGYAGADKATGKKFVGDVYANFAKVEEYIIALYHFVQMIKPQLLPIIDQVDVFLGTPMGGLSFAQMLALVFEKRYLFLEKEVTKAKTETDREESKLIFNRHRLEKYDRIAWVEDVCNNFSTTQKGLELVAQAGGKTIAIVCELNRSLTIEKNFSFDGQDVPVLSLVRKKIMEYKQEDPEVAADVTANNVSWKPKDNWATLMKAMNDNR